MNVIFRNMRGILDWARFIRMVVVHGVRSLVTIFGEFKKKVQMYV
jgi:hypothetical protein